MALSHSPSIIRAGLGFHVDFANPKSISGTALSDISGNNLPIVLTNPAGNTMTIANGYAEFSPATETDNTATYYTISNSYFANIKNEITLETCVYVTNTNSGGTRIVSPRISESQSPLGFGINNGSISVEVNTSTGWLTSNNNASPSITFNKWVHVNMSNTQKSWKGAPTTNLLSNSGQLSLWGKAGGITSVADTALAPDKSYTASLVTANGTTNSCISLGGTIVSGNTYTKSVIAKAGTTGTLVLESYDNNGAGGTGYYITTFNLNAGTYSGTGHTVSMVSMGNGWYHCIATRSYTLNVSGGTFYIGAYGSGIGTLYLWHPMMEQSSTPSSYTASSRSNTQSILDITKNNTITATSLTYASDNTFSFDGTSSYLYLANLNPPNFSAEAWFTGSSGYVFRKSNYGWGLYYVNSTTMAAWVDTDTNHRLTTQTFSVNGVTCITLTFANSLFTIYRNGSQVAQVNTTNSTVYSSDPTFRVGTDSGTTSFLLGTVYSTKVYNRALSAAEVQQIFEATRSRYGI